MPPQWSNGTRGTNEKALRRCASREKGVAAPSCGCRTPPWPAGERHAVSQQQANSLFRDGCYALPCHVPDSSGISVNASIWS